MDIEEKEDIQKFIKNQFLASVRMKEALLTSDPVLEGMDRIVRIMVESFRSGGKVLLCGNGGSAADAQHLSAELSGRFRKDRAPLFAEALHVNTSFLTAVANDYDYESVFARMVDAMGREGDVLLAFSTSGQSGNILAAVRQAQKKGMITAGFTGKDGGELGQICDIEFRMPSDDTARIQEGHMLVGHTICELVEKIMFPE